MVFEFGDTRKLLDELRAGNLDVLIAIGLTPEDTEGLDVIPLVRDTVHFLTTPAQIRKYAPEFPKKKTRKETFPCTVLSPSPCAGTGNTAH